MSERQLEFILETESDERKVAEAISLYMEGEQG